jgi:cation diffusion facilitator family transporter
MLETCTIDKRDHGTFLLNERKTKWVTVITLLTMVVEIIAGYWSGSMALLADGWHMASHSVALGLSLFVYYLHRHPNFKASFTFGGGKILSLGGYTSSWLLVFIAASMIVESIGRFFQQGPVAYKEAMIVAVVGLLVNLVCALILQKQNHSHDHHHHHHDHHGHDHNHHHNHDHHHDHNLHSAYVHILTDALTSVLAIVALVLGQWRGWDWPDPLVGLVGGLVVLKWSVGLIKQSGMDLLDAHEVSIDRQKLIEKIQQDGSQVVDIHLWRLAPGQVGCELIIKSKNQQVSADYRKILAQDFNIQHLIIEVI